MNAFVTKYRLVLLGIVLGGFAGYAWYLQVGCPDGSCPITASPYRSVAYFGLIGALFAHSFVKKGPEMEAIRIDRDSKSDDKRDNV